MPAPVRGRAIQQLGRLVEDNKEALSRLVTREIGKPYAESLGEVQEIVDTCNFFLGEGRRLYGQTVPSEMSDKQLFTFRMPVGVAAIITAGNFPVAVPSWYLVPALLCGNAAVWKPAEYAPATAEALAQLFLHAGLPDGVLNLVLADGPQTFDGLEQALGEGSSTRSASRARARSGARIGALCGRHLQSPCLELGGKNPLVVMADADLDLAVEGALFSGFGTAGQRCTSLGTVIVDERVHDAFLARLTPPSRARPSATRARTSLRPDDPRALPAALRGRAPRAHPRPPRRIRLDRDRAHHGRPPARGFVGGDPEAGLFVHPTLVDGVRVDDDLANTETFGPLVGVASFGDWEEAMALANGHGYGLSASIYTTNPQHAFRYRERISAGMVSVNNSTSGAEAHLPFGGNGKSGNGSRQSGMWVLDQFTRWQALNWDYAGSCRRRRWTSPTSTPTSASAWRSSGPRVIVAMYRGIGSMPAPWRGRTGCQVGPGAGLELTPENRPVVARYLRRARVASGPRRARRRDTPTVVELVRSGELVIPASTPTARVPPRGPVRPTSGTSSAPCAPSSRWPAADAPAGAPPASSPRELVDYLPRRLLLAQRASASPSRSASSSRARALPSARIGARLAGLAHGAAFFAAFAAGLAVSERSVVRRPRRSPTPRRWRPTTPSAHSRARPRRRRPHAPARSRFSGVALVLHGSDVASCTGRCRCRPRRLVLSIARAGTSASGPGGCGAPRRRRGHAGVILEMIPLRRSRLRAAAPAGHGLVLGGRWRPATGSRRSASSPTTSGWPADRRARVPRARVRRGLTTRRHGTVIAGTAAPARPTPDLIAPRAATRARRRRCASLEDALTAVRVAFAAERTA